VVVNRCELPNAASAFVAVTSFAVEAGIRPVLPFFDHSSRPLPASSTAPVKAVPNRVVLTRDERAEEMRRSALDTVYVDATTGWAASEAWAVAAAAGRPASEAWAVAGAAGRATPASAGPAATRPAVSAAPTRTFLTRRRRMGVRMGGSSRVGCSAWRGRRRGCGSAPCGR
jgi:hypothetical protein